MGRGRLEARCGRRIAQYDNPTGHTPGFFHFSSLCADGFTRDFHPRAQWKPESGMVFPVHASAHGMAFSETGLVTPQGPERLTRLDRRLFQGIGP